MRTGQRDLHNTPLKRRLSISYEELETLKKSIKTSVLNELQAEAENSSDLDSFKDQILSEIRTGLLGFPDPSSLKDSILSELRTELSSGRESELGTTERRLKELAGLQDGLVRELLDQKVLIKKLEAEVERLSGALEDMKNTVPSSSPSVSIPVLEDPLDLPPLSRKPKHKLEFRKENSPARELIDFTEAPASLPGTNSKLQLKIKEVEPRELDEREPVEIKCEYIIAESGNRERFRGPLRHQTQIRESREPSDGQLFPSRRPSSLRHQSSANANPVRAPPNEDYKCEYIIAEKAPKKRLIDESVDLREDEDAEIITCSRKDPRT